MPTMQRAMPVLEVADVERSAAFYDETLGFGPGTMFGDPDGHIIGFGQDLRPSPAGPGL